MKKTVVAQSKEHKELIKDGWKPISAFQSYEHVENYNKIWEDKPPVFTGHDLKETSPIYVVMEKEDVSRES
jgi:hypothetical protein